MPIGILLVDKPSGPTSHDVVQIVRRGTREKKVGHAGTLDPLATGLLVVCVGAATRLSDYMRDKNKHYRARVRLGQTTNTYDADGEIIAESAALPDRATAEAALPDFRGVIQQRPPAYSAIKRGGQKAYELARAGKVIEFEPRPVEIYALELLDWAPPEFTLDALCSAGTYIRSLAHDLGQRLGCGAHLTALRRLAAGNFTLDQAVTLHELEKAFAAGDWRRYLHRAEEALPDWPAVRLADDAAKRIVHGQAIPLEAAQRANAWACAYNSAGELIAILRADTQYDKWRPHIVLASSASNL